MSYHEPDYDDYKPTTLSKATAKDLLRTFQSTMSDLTDNLGECYDDDWNKEQIASFNEFEAAMSNLRGSIRIALHALNK